MIDLSKIFVQAELRIREVETDGTIIDIHNEVVAPIQMPGASFIKKFVFVIKLISIFWFSLKVLINQREIYNSNQLYSYKAFIDTELSYSNAVKDAYFSCVAYAKEENPNSVADQGYIDRKNMFASSNKVQTIHKLDCDIFNQVIGFYFQQYVVF
jgi:hypothetical protein